MRGVYRVLAGLIALEVVIQSAAMALAVFGLSKWIEDGGTLDKAAMESTEGGFKFPEEVGFMIHGINGLLVALLALLLLLVAFFAKIPGGVKWAGLVLLATVVQVLLGMFARGLPALGALHGLNALVLFGLAVMALMRARTPGDSVTSDAARERHRTSV